MQSDVEWRRHIDRICAARVTKEICVPVCVAIAASIKWTRLLPEPDKPLVVMHHFIVRDVRAGPRDPKLCIILNKNITALVEDSYSKGL